MKRTLWLAILAAIVLGGTVMFWETLGPTAFVVMIFLWEINSKIQMGINEQRETAKRHHEESLCAIQQLRFLNR